MKPTQDAGADRLIRWVHEHGPAVRAYLLTQVRDHATVDDVLQDVFCRAWESRHVYRDQDKERGYLIRIADRLVKDQVRRGRVETRVYEQQLQSTTQFFEVEEPSRGIEASENQRQLQQALETLSEPQRRTLLLRFFGDLEFTEIAQALDCPLGTALSHCRRGLAALRVLFVEETS